MIATRRLLVSFCALAFVLIAARGSAAQQDASDEIRRELADLRAEIQRLRAEVDELRGGYGFRTVAVRRLGLDEGTGEPSMRSLPVTLENHVERRPAKAPADRAFTPLRLSLEQAPQADSLQPSLEVLQTQVAELAQVKVESTSRMPVKLFGTIHMNAFLNSRDPNWLDSPNLVNTAPADGHSGSFSANLRQTRLGFTVDGPDVGALRANGAVAFDFFGGIPGFATGQVMGLPRLLVAYARLENEKTAVEVGQDHMILAPIDPTSLASFAFPALFRSGNLYLRAPQARVERALTSRLRVMGGIVAPVGGDVPGEDYRFVPQAFSGERSRRPAVQARVGYATGEPDAVRRVNVGVSGHYGWEWRGGVLNESSATALDFAVRRDFIGAAGEIFFGQNIDAFGGAVGQDARASGGWAELQLFPTARLSLAGGAGLDEIRGARRTTVPRRRNQSAYGAALFSLTPEIQASFEYHWLATLPGSGAERRNHHFDWVLAYRF